jgi:hypothetical protein
MTLTSKILNDVLISRFLNISEGGKYEKIFCYDFDLCACYFYRAGYGGRRSDNSKR